MTAATIYILRRAVQIPVVVFFITVVIFSLMHVTPGDPVELMLGSHAMPEAVAAVRAKYHLDEPLVNQYLLWIQRLFVGDLGDSIRTTEPVATMIQDRFPISLMLAIYATVLSLIVAVPVGIVSAVRHNGILDYASMTFAVLGMSVPNFALGLVLIVVFAYRLEWFPITGIAASTATGSFWATVSPWILPVVSLAAAQTAIIARQLRASMLDVLGQDYMRTAHAKGLRHSYAVTKHALKNAMIPVITVVAIQFSRLVGLTITIEYVFAIPGMGTALIQAVVNRDFPVIQGFTLLMALFFIIANLVADVIYTVVDPRIRLG